MTTAVGGPVLARGKKYRVGEQGPEWFIPMNSGYVIKAEQDGDTIDVQEPDEPEPDEEPADGDVSEGEPK